MQYIIVFIVFGGLICWRIGLYLVKKIDNIEYEFKDNHYPNKIQRKRNND